MIGCVIPLPDVPLIVEDVLIQAKRLGDAGAALTGPSRGGV